MSGCFLFPLWFLQWHNCCLVAYCLASTCLCFFQFPFCSWSLVSYNYCQKKILDIISVFLNLLKLVLWPGAGAGPLVDGAGSQGTCLQGLWGPQSGLTGLLVGKARSWGGWWVVLGLVPACWWAGKPPTLTGEREDPKWHFPTPVASWYSELPEMAATTVCVPSGVPVASCLSRRLSKIIKWMWPKLLSNDCFRAVSWRIWNFMCTLWEQSLSSSTVCKQASLAFKARCSGAHLPSAGPLGWGAQCGAWTLHSLGRTSGTVIILLFVGHRLGGVGLHYIVSLLLLLISLWFLLYTLSCEKSSLLVFGWFS